MQQLSGQWSPFRGHISGFYSPDAGSSGGWVFWQEKPTCFSTELRDSGAAVTFLGGGFFSGELLGLSCCCCCCCFRPALLALCGGGDEPSKQDRPDCPFLQPGDVLGKPCEVAELSSFFCDVSKEDLILLDACAFSSLGLTPFIVKVLPEEPEEVLVADEPELSHAAILSAGGSRVEDCPEPTDLLAELKDVWGRRIELLFESPLWPGDNAFERDTADELVFNVFSPLLSFSSVFVLVGFCWVSLSTRWADRPCSSGCPAWGFLWELLKLSAQPVRSKVVCATEASLLPDTSVFFRYFSMSKALSSPTQMLLCSVSNRALWSGSWIYVESKTLFFVLNVDFKMNI